MKNKLTRKLSFTLLISILILTLTPILNTAQAITNGVPDGEGHPYVCLIVVDIWNGTHHVPAFRGTGILIDEYTVLTAGHLTDGASQARVWFDTVVQGDPDYPYSGMTSIEGTPITHPDYVPSGGPGLSDYNWVDVGIVVLDEPVTDKGYGVLPDIGLVDTLEKLTAVDQIGYGVQELIRGGGQPFWIGEKVRYYAPATLIPSKDVLMDDFIKITANPGKGRGGTAFGDSGGPVLLAGTNIIVGLTSWGRNYNCAGISYAARVDTAVVQDWITENM